MDNTDLRIVKTRRTIQNALIDLLEQKSYEDINVQDIVTAALVNRTTFYRHYASKSELADEMIQSFKAYYAERLAGRYSHEQPMAFFRQHFPEFYARRREILALWQIDNRRHHLYADMQAMLQHTFLHHTEALPLHNRHYQATVFAAIALTNLRYWLEQPTLPDINQTFGDFQELFDWIKSMRR